MMFQCLMHRQSQPTGCVGLVYLKFSPAGLVIVALSLVRINPLPPSSESERKGALLRSTLDPWDKDGWLKLKGMGSKMSPIASDRKGKANPENGKTNIIQKIPKANDCLEKLNKQRRTATFTLKSFQTQPFAPLASWAIALQILG